MQAGLSTLGDKTLDEQARIDSNASQMTARHTQALVDLSLYLSVNDKAGALAHVNQVADSESAQSGTKGNKFINIIVSSERTWMLALLAWHGYSRQPKSDYNKIMYNS